MINEDGVLTWPSSEYYTIEMYKGFVEQRPTCKSNCESKLDPKKCTGYEWDENSYQCRSFYTYS